ncbi:tripartite tricarboxylate transporter TctB family protein [Microbacterium halophytorum]|uniref:tripartite tricarboxylate transporter TctB family protein n=1 Tax=Microbacterium halophytorum TaxID=2067568 RepID=UPI000CFD336E|nr:tripartite tricarboxylate transporter TctB family protein [Microbacterium halophytorum]
MRHLLTLDIPFDSYHLVFPYAIGGILVLLLVAMGIQKLISLVVNRAGKRGEPRERRRFFDAGFDWKKLFGTLVLAIAYVFLLDPLGFLISSILFIAAVSFVLRPVFTPRAIIGVALNAILTPTIIWFVFGQLFDITLP